MNQLQSGESLRHLQRERLAYSGFRPCCFGLIDRFGGASAGAARDLTLCRTIAPQTIIFDGSNQICRIGQAFPSLFDHASQRVLSALTLGFGDGVNGATQPPYESPTALSSPKIDVLCWRCTASRTRSVRRVSSLAAKMERKG